MDKSSNNRRFFLNIFSIVMIVYGISAVPSFAVAIYYREQAAMASLGAAAAVCILCGWLIRHFGEMEAANVRQRMNYLATIAVWLIMTAITAIVYYCSHAELTWADSIMQAAASLTTTGTGTIGAGVFPYSLQLWRSTLNWLGGIGFILIAVSCIGTGGFSWHSLLSVEIPGSEYLSSAVSFRKVCHLIINIYIVLTVIHLLLLVAAGMDPFPAVLTAFSNISTSGLQHIEYGVITGLSTPLKAIITFFSFLGSLNISFLIFIVMRKALNASGDTRGSGITLLHTEVSTYTVRIILTAVAVTLFIAAFSSAGFSAAVKDPGFARKAGEALMQTVSFFSTSGYIVTDCHTWPEVCQVIILLQIFIGACAVSTGGGIKNARAQIAFKTVSFGLFKHIHPQAVRPVRYNRQTLKSDQLVSANLYVILFMGVYLLGALFLSLDNQSCSIYDALCYSQAMLTNTGTTIASSQAGITEGLVPQFSSLSKIIMSVEMLAGRLEIYPVLMIFSRSLWLRRTNTRR